MTKLEQFVELWQGMDKDCRVKCLKFLVTAYGMNVLKTCNKLFDELERKRDKRDER
jgi:hypothetical protein